MHFTQSSQINFVRQVKNYLVALGPVKGNDEAMTSLQAQTVAVRQAIRLGRLHGQTSGMAPGAVQANVVILPRAAAEHFLRFAQRNPKPCPVLGVSEPGAFGIPALGQDLDIRTDLTGYNVYRNGELQEQRTDVVDLWREDFVWFAIGCSFSFEEALIAEGIPLRHVEQGRNVAMYKTNQMTQAAGPFSGPLVVSMRPMSAAHAIRAIQITSRFPAVHGAPVHFGDPAAIGIADLSRPDWGDAVDAAPGDVPVFWACGVTPQAALRNARPEICITHQPGHMLVTDLSNHQLAAL